MSKSMKDIKKAGGKCKKVATNFWECTSKDGKKVWWCDGTGQCVEKPSSSPSRTPEDIERDGGKCTRVSDKLTICADSRGYVYACENDGSCAVIIRPKESKPKPELRKRIRKSAIEALRNFPPSYKCEEHANEEVSLFLTQSRKLIERCTHAKDWSDEELECVVDQIAFIRSSFRVGLGLGFAVDEPSCTFRCKDERDDCLRDDGCTGGWPCFCCVPCNLAWLTCTADCIV